jgi:hypothetical protein
MLANTVNGNTQVYAEDLATDARTATISAATHSATPADKEALSLPAKTQKTDSSANATQKAAANAAENARIASELAMIAAEKQNQIETAVNGAKANEVAATSAQGAAKTADADAARVKATANQASLQAEDAAKLWRSDLALIND